MFEKMILNDLKLKRQRNHVWGDYYEYRVTEDLLFRSIRIFQGAMNSMHCHDTSEIMLVESGSINCWMGADLDSVTVRNLKEGETVYIPAGVWHRIEFVAGDYEVRGVLFAQIVELMFGKHLGGAYEIRRNEPAVPGLKPSYDND